jgi:hypothetical protein
VSEARVFIAKYDYQADHKVFFVDQDYQEQNAQLITPGKLVQNDYDANVKVFIVDYEYQATIKITRGHFPKP